VDDSISEAADLVPIYLGVSFFELFGNLFAASPIISKFLITASTVLGSAEKLSGVKPAV
jgi:hypothetical protein